jgi:hypothetical protein
MARTLADAAKLYRALVRLRDGTEYNNERQNAQKALDNLTDEHEGLVAYVEDDDGRIAEDDAARAQGYKDAADRVRVERESDRLKREVDRERGAEAMLARMIEKRRLVNEAKGGGCGPVPLYSSPRGVPPVNLGYTSPTVSEWRSPTKDPRRR